MCSGTLCLFVIQRRLPFGTSLRLLQFFFEHYGPATRASNVSLLQGFFGAETLRSTAPTAREDRPFDLFRVGCHVGGTLQIKLDNYRIFIYYVRISCYLSDILRYLTIIILMCADDHAEVFSYSIIRNKNNFYLGQRDINHDDSPTHAQKNRRY